MKYILSLLLLSGILAACSDEPENEPKVPKNETYFEGILTTFEGSKFKNTVHTEILKELNICEFKAADSTDFAICSPENFKISAYKNEGNLKDAFILEMKAGIFPKDAEIPLPPVRHVIVFEREGGKLVKVGGFRGNLIGKRPNETSGAQDLLIGLYDTDDETLFHCVFKWNGKKYQFHSIERMDYGDGFRTLKGADRLEMTQQIFQQLQSKSLIF